MRNGISEFLLSTPVLCRFFFFFLLKNPSLILSTCSFPFITKNHIHCLYSLITCLLCHSLHSGSPSKTCFKISNHRCLTYSLSLSLFNLHLLLALLSLSSFLKLFPLFSVTHQSDWSFSKPLIQAFIHSFSVCVTVLKEVDRHCASHWILENEFCRVLCFVS